MLNLNTTYSFETLVPAMLGAKIKNAKLIAVLDYSTVSAFINPHSQHSIIYPHLPPNTPRDLTKYIYYLFRTENNETAVFANVWINESTIKEINTNSIKIEVFNVGADDLTRINKLLMSAGFDSFNTYM